MRTLALILVAFCFYSCSRDNSTDEPILKLSEPTRIMTLDVANSGNASDIELSFNRPTFREPLEEYRVYIVKSEHADAFDESMALQVDNANYVVLDTESTGEKITFGPETKDVDGDAVVEGVNYSLFVLAKATTDSGLEDELSVPSQVMLTQTSAVRELTIKGVTDAADGFITVDDNDNVYLAGRHEDVIYHITPDGTISEFATIEKPAGMDFDNEGNLYVVSGSPLLPGFLQEPQPSSILKITPEGRKEEFAMYKEYLKGLVFDGSSNFYACSCSDNNILKIDMNGNVTVLAHIPNFSDVIGEDVSICPFSIDIDKSGNLYVIGETWDFESSRFRLYKISPSGSLSTLTPLIGEQIFDIHGGLVVHDNVIYVSHRRQGKIYNYSFSGVESVFAGAGGGDDGQKNGSLTEAAFSSPGALAFNNDGSRMYIVEAKGVQPPGLIGRIEPIDIIVRVVSLVE